MLDLSNVKDDFTPIPPGTYSAFVSAIDKKTTSSGTGEYYKVELTITTQGQNGRKVWDNFNVKNDNAKAVQIGLAKLKQLALSSGISESSLSKFDPTMLATKEVQITTGIKVGDGEYSDQAIVKKYAPLKAMPKVDRKDDADSIPF